MARSELYEFGVFRLDVADRRLSTGGTTIHLSPKAHDVLVALVREAGRLVTKRELLASVWAEAFVEEGILTVHISSLRKALGDTSRAPTYMNRCLTHRQTKSSRRKICSAKPHGRWTLMRSIASTQTTP